MLAHPAPYRPAPAYLLAPLFSSLDPAAALQLPAVANGWPGQGRRWRLGSASSMADQLRGGGEGRGGIAAGCCAPQQASAEGLAGSRSVPGEGNGLLALMLASSSEGICCVNAQGACLFINPAGAAMLGYAPEELIGGNLHELLHQRHADGSAYPAGQCPIVMVAAGTGAAVRLDGAVFWRKDGSAVCLSYCASPLVRDGQPAGAVMVFGQTTERQRRMDELLEADRRRTEFLATLAHELNSPLAPLRTGLAVLRLQGASAQALPVLEMMEHQVSHMARLVEDLLDTGRIASGQVELRRERVPLKSIILGAIEMCQPVIDDKRHALAVDALEESLLLDADATRIRQVLVNLLRNAARYTPEGGRIAISARRDGAHAVVAVSDNGVGMAQDCLARAFEMFSQGDAKDAAVRGGLGIGLALVRHYVELHGGQVSGVSPGVGQGSTFTVRLPLAQSMGEPAPAALPPGEPPAAPARGLRILLVDDDAQSARLLATALELKGHGHVVTVAGGGAQAVQLARQFRPEVAFLDIDMPGMNGCEAAQALRQIEGLDKLVLVALTGWDAGKNPARWAKEGFDHHLAKPTPLDAVDALLSKVARLPADE